MLRMNVDENVDGFASREDLTFLRLLQLADSALPIGALAHSFGLESLVAAEILTAKELPEFLRGYLQEAGMVEAVACREASQIARPQAESFSAARWIEINDSLSALKPARESRAASTVLGRNFLQATLLLGDCPVLRVAREASLGSSSLIHHSAAFGLISATLGFDE